MRFLAMFALVGAMGFGSAEAAISTPSGDAAETAPRIEPAAAPAALGSPCFGSMAMMADRQELAFTLDLFSTGAMGYAPVSPPGEDNSMLGLICRLGYFPIGRN